ncbi:MAG: dihydroorotase [Clostridiales bacterium]|nr:dihydroorotase [Clostridiales bacterium]
MEKSVIKNAAVISLADNINTTADILIEDGKIVRIDKNIDAGCELVDAHGLCAIPGLTDMHVHLRDPGQTDKEDIYSGCKAAAAGGVTSLLTMPNTRPTVDNAEVVRYILDKAKDADAHVYAAASITKGLKSEEPTDIEELKNAGAVALSDDGRPVVNTKLLSDAMKRAPSLNMKVVAHCEDLYLADGGKINEGEISRKIGVKGIPASAEDCGTAREIALAAALDVPIHICHVSTKTSVELIRDAKRRGVKVTAETAPHYFSLTEKELLRGDADYRMNPPLRTREDVEAIIEGLRDGTLDAIATDHAPHTPEEKADFVKAPNGSIGMETSLAVGITNLVKPGYLTFAELIEKMSINPAKILGINSGRLCVGAPADIALVDPDEVWTVDENKLHGKSKNTPFKGRTLYGKVKMTFLNGKAVFEDKDE